MLISFFPLLLWITAKNRTRLKKLFNWTTKSGWLQYHKQINCTWLFISNCKNASDILDWMWFLHYFWLQEFIPQETEKLMNKKKVSLTQQIYRHHRENPLWKNLKSLFISVPFSRGSKITKLNSFHSGFFELEMLQIFTGSFLFKTIIGTWNCL